jgi:hypothetical protein
MCVSDRSAVIHGRGVLYVLQRALHVLQVNMKQRHAPALLIDSVSVRSFIIYVIPSERTARKKVAVRFGELNFPQLGKSLSFNRQRAQFAVLIHLQVASFELSVREDC